MVYYLVGGDLDGFIKLFTGPKKVSGHILGVGCCTQMQSVQLQVFCLPGIFGGRAHNKNNNKL